MFQISEHYTQENLRYYTKKLIIAKGQAVQWSEKGQNTGIK